jgi:hypothetical protein
MMLTHLITEVFSSVSPNYYVALPENYVIRLILHHRELTYFFLK